VVKCIVATGRGEAQKNPYSTIFMYCISRVQEYLNTVSYDNAVFHLNTVSGRGEAFKKACQGAVAVSTMLLNNDATLLKHVDRQGKTVLHHVAHSGKCEDLVSLPPPPRPPVSLSLSLSVARARSPRPPAEAKRPMIEARGTYARSKETYDSGIRDLLEAKEAY
jgi:hypothetical protein